MKRNTTHRTRDRYLTPEEAAKYREIREQIEREMPEILERRKRQRELEQAAAEAGTPFVRNPACIAAEQQAVKDYPGCDEFRGGVVREESDQIVVDVVYGKRGFDFFPMPIARYVVDTAMKARRYAARGSASYPQAAQTIQFAEFAAAKIAGRWRGGASGSFRPRQEPGTER
jgi:hypothetical protein